MSNRLHNGPPGPTPRQLDVLALVSHANTTGAIATQSAIAELLGRSAKTVQIHVAPLLESGLLKSGGTGSRTGLVVTDAGHAALAAAKRSAA